MAGRPLLPLRSRTVAGRIGCAIRAARLAAGLTLQQLSAGCGVPFTTLADWEHGRSAPPADKLRRLAAACGVGVLDLLP